MRVLEELRKGSEPYGGKITVLRDYLRQIRPRRGRMYQEVCYEPGQAMQVDWGHCGAIRVGNTLRQLSVFVAVLCYSRLCYLEFCLSQRKPEFYRSIVRALEFFRGSPLRIILDNLKAAVLNGAGREACFHPEFLALCGHSCLQPVACAPRDPESKASWRPRCGTSSTCQTPHQLEALKLRRRLRARHVENTFDALGEEAQKFHLELRRRPVKTIVHLRRLLHLVQLYGRQEVLAALQRANEYPTYDAAYVETILLQARRRRELPSPTEVRPQRQEWIEEIDVEEPDPGTYDRLCDDGHNPEESSHD